MPPTPSKSSSTPVTCAGSQPSSPPIIPAAVGFRPLRKRPCRGTLLDLILKNGRHVELGGTAWRTGWNDAERRQDQELERTVPAHRWRRDHWPCSSYLSPSHPSRQAVRVSGSHGCFSLESPSMLRKRVFKFTYVPVRRMCYFPEDAVTGGPRSWVACAVISSSRSWLSRASTPTLAASCAWLRLSPGSVYRSYSCSACAPLS